MGNKKKKKFLNGNHLEAKYKILLLPKRFHRLNVYGLQHFQVVIGVGRTQDWKRVHTKISNIVVVIYKVLLDRRLVYIRTFEAK